MFSNRIVVRIAGLMMASAAMAGCATIIQGSAQSIAVSSSPSGAYCTLARDGRVIGRIEATPDVVNVEKTKDDILLNCSAAGYAPSSQYLHSGIATGTYGNIILGGVIGWGIDSATGSDNEYPSAVSVTFAPLPNQVASQNTAAARPKCTREEQAQVQSFQRLAEEKGVQYRPPCI